MQSFNERAIAFAENKKRFRKVQLYTQVNNMILM